MTRASKGIFPAGKGICPACNGLTTLQTACPFCGESMLDQGSVSEYYGPYSPYVEEDTLTLLNLWTPKDLEQSSEGEDCPIPCIHLLACPRCGWDSRVPVDLVPPK